MVHMPSHIDVLRGRWKEAVVANEKAIAADRKFMKNRPVKGLYGAYMAHNYDMLAFAAMMRGQKAKALAAIDEMFQRLPAEWLKEFAGFLDPGAMMARPLEVRMRFGMWDDVLAQPEPGAEFPVSRAMRHFARGVALAAKRDFSQARAEQTLFLQSVKTIPTDGPYAVGPQGAILKVAELALEGEILFQEGKGIEGLAKLRLAAEAEDQIPYMEPPYWLQPVRHALGAALLSDGKLDEAERVYRDDLKRHPENGWSLLGLANALERQNRFADAKPVRKRLAAAWKESDTPLTSSCLCLPGN
jgi:tetratricopeptide (TPR) repeat protein